MNAIRERLLALLLLVGAQAMAQTIPVTTPKLPSRSAGAAQPAAQAAPYGAGAAAAAQAAPSTRATPQTAAYGGTPQPAAYGGTAQTTAMVAPQRAAAGTCRVQPTPDRQTLALVSGAEALARQHLPLGEFRAQQVVHSPDGRWAVVYTKLRGAAQYAAITIDLERCEQQRVIDLNAAGEDVRFEGDDAVLRLSVGELRVSLRDGRVR